MKVKIVVEISAEEMAEKRNFFPGIEDEDILMQYISEDEDEYLQDIEVKII